MPDAAPSPAADPLALLDSLPRYATSGRDALRPGLERVEAMLSLMGNPHRRYPIVHVAGTNGKGSTASMIAALATAAGLRTGLHTSPHLVSVGERMRVNGVSAPEVWVGRTIGPLHDDIRRLAPSFFEVTVALSLLRFAEVGVDVAVVETGLGGRLDATNVVFPVVSVITDIAMDHAEILGATRTLIAREKAGIVKPGVPVVASDSGPEVESVLREAAARAGAPIEFVRPPFVVPPLDLAGAHQRRNAALAMAAARVLRSVDPSRFGLDPQAIASGLARVRELTGLRARFETVSERPRVIVDVAHNPDGLGCALATFRGAVPPDTTRRIVCLGIMRDKDLPSIAALLASDGAEVMPVDIPSDRARPSGEIAAAVGAAGGRVPGTLPGPAALAEWIRSAAMPADSILVVGSFQLAGPFLASWESPGSPRGFGAFHG